MHDRTLRLTLLLFCLASCLAQPGCAPRGGDETGSAAFWTPPDPPGASYAFDAKIAVDGENVSLTAQGTISFVNSTRRPMTVIAFEWTIKPSSEFAVSVGGRALEVLNGPRNMPLTTPLLVALPRPLRPGEKADLDVRFSRRSAVSGGQVHLGVWYPRLWWDGLRTKDAFEVRLEAPPGFVLATSGRLDPATGAYRNACVTSHFGI